MIYLKGKRGSECLLKSVSNIDFNPHCVTQRIDAHIEHLNRHPMDIRRYYRQFDY